MSLLSFRHRTTTGGFALFGLLGAVQALYGPLIPSMRASFHISTAVAGLILSAYFAGAVVGILLSGVIRDLIALRWRLSIASFVLVLGCVGLASATLWPVALAATVGIGLGGGGLIIAFNTLFSIAFGGRSPAMVNLLNAAYGCGAVLGPLAVGLIIGTSFRTLFVVAAIITLCLVPTVLSAPDDRLPLVSDSAGDASPPLLLLATFIALFLLYEGVESNIGGWEATQLTARGISTSAAANATAFFWAALTAGRIVLAPLSVRVAPGRIIIAALTIVTFLMLLAHFSAFTAIAYTLGGLGLASVFPVAFVWLGRTFPHSKHAPSLAVMAALLGGVVFPPIVGKWISVSTPEVLPTALTVFAGLCLAVAVRLQVAAQAARPDHALLSRSAGASPTDTVEAVAEGATVCEG